MPVFSRSGIRDDECAVVTGRFTNGTLATALLPGRTVPEIEKLAAKPDVRELTDSGLTDSNTPRLA